VGECLVAGFAFYLNPISLREVMTWVGDACLEHAVIGEQQQALAVEIQPSRRMESRGFDDIRQGLAAVTGRKTGEYLIGLVQEQQGHAALSTNSGHLVSDPSVVAGRCLLHSALALPNMLR